MGKNKTPMTKISANIFLNSFLQEVLLALVILKYN